MDKQEVWVGFCNTYREYITSFRKSRILTNASLILLKDFPKNLPDEYQGDYESFVDSFKKILDSMVEDLKKDEEYMERFGSKGKMITPEQELMFYLAQHVFTKAKKKDFRYEVDELLYIDFENILMNNELIIVFAYLDSFLGDSLELFIK